MIPQGQLQTAGAPAVRSASFRVAVLCIVAAAMCPFVPFVPLGHVFLYVVVLVMALCLIVPIWYSWGRDELDWFAPVNILGALYFAYFGLGSLAAVHDPKAVYDLHIPPHVPRAAFYCLLGYFAALAAYYLPWRPAPRPRFVERPAGAGFLFAAACVGLVGFLARAALQQYFRGGRVHAVLSTAVLAPLFVFASAIAWYLFFSKQLTRGQRWVLFGVLVPGSVLIIFLTVGNKSLSMTLLGLPLIARWYAKRRVPWAALIVLLLVLVFIVFPLYNTYRWYGEARHSDRMVMSYDTVTNWSSSTYFDNSIGTFTARMAIINSVALVVRDVGRWQPYAWGETIFSPLATAFIPRLLWPGKPMPKPTEFGQRFRVTNWFTRNVLIAPSWPGDLYWNFGVPGIVFGLALAGFVLRWIYRRYVETVRGPVPLGIWIMLLCQCVVQVEGEVAPTVVDIVRNLLLAEGVRAIGLNYGFIVREPIEE